MSWIWPVKFHLELPPQSCIAASRQMPKMIRSILYDSIALVCTCKTSDVCGSSQCLPGQGYPAIMRSVCFDVDTHREVRILHPKRKKKKKKKTAILNQPGVPKSSNSTRPGSAAVQASKSCLSLRQLNGVNVILRRMPTYLQFEKGNY